MNYRATVSSGGVTVEGFGNRPSRARPSAAWKAKKLGGRVPWREVRCERSNLRPAPRPVQAQVPA